MIDPITAAVATRAGSRVVGSLATTAANVLENISSAVPLGQPSFASSTQKVAQTALRKLFALHPEVKAQLGEGPYNLIKNADGTLTLSSSKTGNNISFDKTTLLGQQVANIYDSFAQFQSLGGDPKLMVKNLEKGLEISVI